MCYVVYVASNPLLSVPETRVSSLSVTPLFSVCNGCSQSIIVFLHRVWLFGQSRRKVNYGVRRKGGCEGKPDLT